MTTKKKALLVGLIVGGLLTALATVSNGALATSTPPTSSDTTVTTNDTTVIATGPTETSTSGYPPGFDVVVDRVKASGAPDLVKQRLIERIDAVKDGSIPSPSSLGALGALIGRTVVDSPLRDQIREQLRLRLDEFDRDLQAQDAETARGEIRQIMHRYRDEMLALVQERLHTRLDGLIARLPELSERIDSEAWRSTLTALRDDVMAATDLADLRAAVVEVRTSLAELLRDVRN